MVWKLIFLALRKTATAHDSSLAKGKVWQRVYVHGCGLKPGILRVSHRGLEESRWEGLQTDRNIHSELGYELLTYSKSKIP